MCHSHVSKATQAPADQANVKCWLANNKNNGASSTNKKQSTFWPEKSRSGRTGRVRQMWGLDTCTLTRTHNLTPYLSLTHTQTPSHSISHTHKLKRNLHGHFFFNFTNINTKCKLDSWLKSILLTRAGEIGAALLADIWVPATLSFPLCLSIWAPECMCEKGLGFYSC